MEEKMYVVVYYRIGASCEISNICMIETEKYIVRNLCENDFEDVKALLKENEYLGMLWSAEMLPEDRLDELVRRLYINRDNGYGVVDKKNEKVCDKN